MTYAGFLRKESPEQHERMRSLLATARAIVHPTVSDIAPLILVEAAYFGCPAISSRLFAIPELVEDNTTGILLADPRDCDELVHSMRRILEDDQTYRTMRLAAWRKSHSQHSKERFEVRLREIIAGVAANAGLLST